MEMIKTLKKYFAYRYSLLYLIVMALSCGAAFATASFIHDKMIATILQAACYIIVLFILQRIGAIFMAISREDPDS